MPEGEGGPSICLYSLGDLGPGHLLIHFQKWKCNNEKCQKGSKILVFPFEVSKSKSASANNQAFWMSVTYYRRAKKHW